MINSDNKRINWIDSIKGFGIILVVLGHTSGIDIYLYKFIYSFHMPLFFILSGYLWNYKKYRVFSFRDIFLKKFKLYILPYFFFAIVNLILQILWRIIILRDMLSISEIYNYLFGILYCYADVQHMPNCSPIWFLMCLFLSSILFWLLLKYFRKYALIISCMFALLSYAIYLFIDFRIPLNFSTALMAVLFMYLGLKLRELSILEKLVSKRIFVIFMIIIGVFLSQINDVVGMNENNYGYLLLFIITSIFLSVSFLFLFKNVDVLDNKIFNIFGRNTMLVIGFNYFIRDFSTEIYYLIPILRDYEISSLVSFLFTIAIIFVMILLCEKTKRIIQKTMRGN